MGINSKILRFFCTSLTTLSLGFTSTVMAGCSIKPEPVDKTPRIEAPTARSKTVVLDKTGQTTIIFRGFQYYGIDIGLIKVTDNFVFEPLVSDDPEICDINYDDQTFAVKIEINGADVELEGLKGNFHFESMSHQEFKYDDDLEFEITILQYDSITLPSQTTKVVDINPSGETTLTFRGFQYHGSNVDEDTFEVKNTFKQGDVKFISQVTNLRVMEHEFDVQITISEDLIPSRSIVGRFQFYRDGILVPIENDSDITLIINEAKIITIPDDVKRFYSATIDKDSNATFTIPNIQFTGLENPDKLQVSNSGFVSATVAEGEQKYCDDVSFAISNWSLDSKSFDIVVTFTNCRIAKQQGFFNTFLQLEADCQFVFTYDGQEIPLNIDPDNSRFDYFIDRPVPVGYLDITDGVLKGFQPDVEMNTLYSYSVLTIPETVVEIADNAFKDVLTGGHTINIQRINFEHAINLKKIGASAFSGCTNLSNNFFSQPQTPHDTIEKLGLSLPNSLSVIGDYAFAGCGFEGSLSFSNNFVENLTIGMAPFKNCKFDKVYMSTSIQKVAYTKNPAPTPDPDPVPVGEGSFCGLTNVKEVHFEYYDRGIPGWISSDQSDVHLFDDIGSQIEGKVAFSVWNGSGPKEEWEAWLTTKASLSLEKVYVDIIN